MPITNWKTWIERIVHPQVADHELKQKLTEIRRHLPLPVIWLLGKTQSGKSSLIRVLTGSTAAEIGTGFKPCTATAMFFDFPDAENAFVRFLDTRGLSEADYDPKDDIRWCEQQAHLVLAVLKATDHQQDAVIAALRKIHNAHPQWPIIVVQTALHEGYPQPTLEHVLPYPFAGGDITAAVPLDLRRSLLRQRASLTGIKARFVAVDFTLPEDGYRPSDYGIEALWEALEEALPHGLKAMLEEGKHVAGMYDIYSRTAHAHIVGYSLSAGLAAAIPLPAASLGTVIAIQAKLLHSIANVYGLPLRKQSLSEIGSALGIGALAGMGGRELLKLIPVYGQSAALGIAGLYSAAWTYALGKTLCFYFAQTKQGKALQPESLRDVFEAEFTRGRRLLRDSIDNREA
ncbi:MAG: GTPase family protein [Gammaproteobacteria bacterium]